MEELTKLQETGIQHAVHKMYASEKIVNHDINLEKWKFKKLYANMIWVQKLDEPDADTILNNGLYIPTSVTKTPFRLGKILMAGPDVKDAVAGEYIEYPFGVGANHIKKVGGYRTCFLRETDVIAVVEPDGDINDAMAEIKDKILLQ